ncbi:hypothetical protein N0V93_000288 [Gnomoniopsis smithogilvyi]|uniref:AN1-type domain-containing protein n=1 Tax=Gnomoniopsis smithogilvyi TaxID=1191159 RepID=A0A9W8YZD7_9PEZI|nr:hypothetical protein N0V93_000288 [Gnomoniopsis smithogilvyi]
MAKPRCPAKVSDDGKECRKLAHPIVGKCDDCGKMFCSAHRFMEEHNCEMQALVSSSPDDPFRNVQWWMTKQKLFADNAEQLLKERTQVVRI